MSVEILQSSIPGVFELIGAPFCDHRGYFLNLYRASDSAFAQVWGDRTIHQINLSISYSVGSIRGLHFQTHPYSEAKLVRCTYGCVWDVVVDLRPYSVTYRKWFSLELSSEKGNSVFIPEGCAHGFQVLEPSSQMLYLHSSPWIPSSESGLRFDDPLLSITWPLPPVCLSQRDLSFPYLSSV